MAIVGRREYTGSPYIGIFAFVVLKINESLRHKPSYLFLDLHASTRSRSKKLRFDAPAKISILAR